MPLYMSGYRCLNETCCAWRAALATRSGIRAQPSFLVPPSLTRDDARELIEALNACAWSGFVAFLASGVSVERLFSCVERAKSIAQVHAGDRPEMMAALAFQRMVLQQSPDGGTQIISQLEPPPQSLGPLYYLTPSEVINSVGLVLPPSFGQAAADAVRQDQEILSSTGDLYKFGFVPLWPAGSPPSEWAAVLAEWSRMLGNLDFVDFQRRHFEMLRQVEAGTFDWFAPAKCANWRFSTLSAFVRTNPVAFANSGFQDDGFDCTLTGYQVYRAESARLGNHSVDAVAAGQISASEEKLESLPSTEADDHRVRNIPRSSCVTVRQQLSALVDRINAVVAGHIFAGQQKLEVLPSTEADDHRIRNIPRSSGIPVGQQLPARDGLDLDGEGTPQHGAANIDRCTVCRE